MSPELVRSELRIVDSNESQLVVIRRPKFDFPSDCLFVNLPSVFSET